MSNEELLNLEVNFIWEVDSDVFRRWQQHSEVNWGLHPTNISEKRNKVREKEIKRLTDAPTPPLI